MQVKNKLRSNLLNIDEVGKKKRESYINQDHQCPLWKSSFCLFLFFTSKFCFAYKPEAIHITVKATNGSCGKMISVKHFSHAAASGSLRANSSNRQQSRNHSGTEAEQRQLSTKLHIINCSVTSNACYISMLGSKRSQMNDCEHTVVKNSKMFNHSEVEEQMKWVSCYC